MGAPERLPTFWAALRGLSDRSPPPGRSRPPHTDFEEHDPHPSATLQGLGTPSWKLTILAGHSLPVHYLDAESTFIRERPEAAGRRREAAEGRPERW